MKSRVLVIGLAVALLPLVACNVYPDNGYWPNGRPVHPRMVPPPQPDEIVARASCVIGLTEEAHSLIERLVEDPYLLQVEEWSWWLATDGLNVPSLADCLTSWVADRERMRFWYQCGVDVHEYFLSHDEAWLNFFVRFYVCDARGFAYYPCFPDCGLGLNAVATEPNGTDVPVDPTDPQPPQPIVCTPDPRDTRLCLEMEP